MTEHETFTFDDEEAAQPVTIPSRPDDPPCGLAPLYAALADAQGEFPPIERRRVATVKTKNHGSYSYKYADMADILAAVRPVLAANGLSIMQWPDGPNMMTRIAHSSGAQQDFPFPLKPMPGRSLEDAQQFQSAFQVARRYSAQSALGISTEETLEGDHSRALGNANRLDDNFKSGDGVRMPRGAQWDKSKSAEENAKAASDAIIAQFQEAKTQSGVNGAWNRNEMFIAKFEDKFPSLYADVLDAFHAAMEAREG